MRGSACMTDDDSLLLNVINHQTHYDLSRQFTLVDDHSRVKLRASEDEVGSDYINANYIPVRNDILFILTLGIALNSCDF